jgi:glucokinase
MTGAENPTEIPASEPILAADVGGTNARFALVHLENATWTIRERKTYPSAQFDGLAAIVNQYCADIGIRPDRAGFGVPCPVRDGPCRFANLDWEVDPDRLARDIRIARTIVVNDFEAIGHAIPTLGPEDLAIIQDRPPVARGAIAILGAGTGLGQAFLFWQNGHYEVIPSEGGHADFAPRNELETEMFLHWNRKLGRISWERFLAGPGLVRIYRFLVDSNRVPESEAVASEMTRRDSAAVITEHGLRADDPACTATLEIFTSIYGAQAGNLGLTVRSTGGVYLAGGIAPRILEALKKGPFLDAFRAKGRLSSLTEQMPVRVITEPNVGLIGAACAANDVN